MALKKPSKPKFKKLPKQPKAGASTESWKAYENKVKQIESENDKLIADYRKKQKEYENEIKKRESIKNKAIKAKAKLNGIS